MRRGLDPQVNTGSCRENPPKAAPAIDAIKPVSHLSLTIL
jgi:hypothetical protein